MHFVVTAHDGPDTLDRRMELRDEHVARAKRAQAEGSLLYGLALLDEDGMMSGSVMVFEFESRAQMDEWLEAEPYVTGGVWERVEVSACRVGAMVRPSA